MKMLQPLTSSFVIAFLVLALPVHAATIDSTAKYGWSNVGGWVNFAPTQGGLTITDSTITGYAWAENTGWISFDTTQSGVTNDGQGNLGGFAWSEGEGWLSFTGVTIDDNGYFTGVATGSDSAIIFNCVNCSVRTDWRPPSSDESPEDSSGSTGDRTGRHTSNSSNETTPPTSPPRVPEDVFGSPSIPDPKAPVGDDTGVTPSDSYTSQNQPETSSEPPQAATDTASTSSGVPPLLAGGIVSFLVLTLLFLFRFFFRPRV